MVDDLQRKDTRQWRGVQPSLDSSMTKPKVKLNFFSMYIKTKANMLVLVVNSGIVQK